MLCQAKVVTHSSWQSLHHWHMRKTGSKTFLSIQLTKSMLLVFTLSRCMSMANSIPLSLMTMFQLKQILVNLFSVNRKIKKFGL